jgi:PDZ domain-containing protein
VAVAATAKGLMSDLGTVEPMLQGGPLGWDPLPAHRGRRRLPWFLAAFVLAVVLVVGTRVNLPYYAISPGEARQVDDLIKVPADKAVTPHGRILLTTVALGQVRGFEILADWLNRDVSVVPEKQILGTTPRGQLRQQNVQEMDESKEAAVVAALRRLGYNVPQRGAGALISFVQDGSPAAGRLKVGQVITAVDGKPTTSSEDAVSVIRSHRPGDTVTVQVDPADGSAVRTEPFTLGSRDAPPTSCPQGSAGVTRLSPRAFLGVSLATRNGHYDLPFPVTIDSAGIGGPSAGLAFSLGVIDELTRADLAGGGSVAVTGTIQPDGVVGEVGGVVQKTAAVRRTAARTFLVPCGEYKQAQAHAGSHLRVIPVATLDDALVTLGHLGANLAALPPAARTAQG